MEYYVHDAGNQHGPFSAEELTTKTFFKPDAMIWHEGMADWVKASDIETLKGLLKPTPPPLHKPPVSSFIEEKTFTPKSVPAKSSFSLSRPFVIIVIIIILGYVAYSAYDKQQKTSQEQDLRTQVRNNIRSYVSTGNSQYRINGLGGIYGLSIDVANNSSYLLDNVRVMIRYIKSNGETWKEEQLDFALVPPNSKITLRAPDSDRGTSIDYKIVSIKSNALGL